MVIIVNNQFAVESIVEHNSVTEKRISLRDNRFKRIQCFLNAIIIFLNK